MDDRDEDQALFDANELEQSQFEARVMAKKIKSMITERVPIFNPKTGIESTCGLQRYRDFTSFHDVGSANYGRV